MFNKVCPAIMEEKLAEYRRKKQATALKEPQPGLLQSISSVFVSRKNDDPIDPSHTNERSRPDAKEEEEDIIPIEEIDYKWRKIDFVILALKLSLWGSLWVMANNYELGLCFIILSGFLFIYVNLSDRQKRPSERSAYSVFNRGCRSLDGALTAEHFEKAIGKGKKSS
uniref:C6orf64 n=1 Tax=Caligus clemensi TaxID=344056 RepID=C1C2H7_CALCM|nr:C6orf64 [Caligus clemensi]